MFRFFVCINLLLAHVFCQTIEDSSQFNTDFLTTQSWQQDTTEQSLELDTKYETTQSSDQLTTQQALVLNTNIDATQLWNEVTTERSLELSTNTDATQLWNEVSTEQPLELSTNTDATQLWNEVTTEQPSKLSTNIDTTQLWEQITTGEPFQPSTGNDTTQTWQEFTTEETSEQENFTTTQQITSTMEMTSCTTCPPSITPEMLEEIKKEIIDAVLLAVSREINSTLEAIEERLSALNCSNDRDSPPIELDWQIYQDLQIPLTGWLRVFDQPYSHKTRIDDLNQIAGICHNQVLVAATFNGSISLAAVGPASVLTLNTLWNQPQQFGQVYWYRTNGKSFGFSPIYTIRQTSADNQDLDSPYRLSWLLDQDMGGYRAGVTRSLADNLLWHKVIYCN